MGHFSDPITTSETRSVVSLSDADVPTNKERLLDGKDLCGDRRSHLGGDKQPASSKEVVQWYGDDSGVPDELCSDMPPLPSGPEVEQPIPCVLLTLGQPFTETRP